MKFSIFSNTSSPSPSTEPLPAPAILTVIESEAPLKERVSTPLPPTKELNWSFPWRIFVPLPTLICSIKVILSAPSPVALLVLKFTSTEVTAVSLWAKSTQSLFPSPPSIVSSPLPPERVSSPLPPRRVSAPLFPLSVSASSLPLKILSWLFPTKISFCVEPIIPSIFFNLSSPLTSNVTSAPLSNNVKSIMLFVEL